MSYVTIPFHFSHRLYHEDPNQMERECDAVDDSDTALTLNFVDDLAPLYHSHRQMQDKATYMARISAEVYKNNINNKKAQIVRVMLLVKDQSCWRLMHWKG